MERTDLLLAFLAAPQSTYDTDQIRIMKGLFLLDQEGPTEYRDAFEFEAFDYGPFDVGVYRDIETLKRQGLVEETSDGSTRRVYRLTRAGQLQAASLASAMDPESWRKVAETKRLVTKMRFQELLRHVYATYPDYAKNSRARL